MTFEVPGNSVRAGGTNMTWTTKLKDLPTTAKVGYSSADPNLSGRAPQQTALNFSPLELFGAAARCSHLHLLDPTIATTESEMIAALVAPHVDNISDDFAVLATADSFKDYVKGYFAGTVATGLAYLAMINEGYVWSDHFENAGGGHPSHARKPDFVFGGIGTGVSLMESKGARSGSLTGFDSIVADGYTGQVEPHLGHLVGGAMATHGYCIGSWLKSTTQAELRIHHTRTPAQQNAATNPAASSLATVQRHNFATAFTLTHSPELGIDLRRGDGGFRPILFLRVEWLGRRWLTGFEAEPIFWPGFIDGPLPPRAVRRLLRRRWRSERLPLLIFAVEQTVAKTVLANFLAPGGIISTDIPDIRPLDEDVRGAAKSYRDGGGGAVFPDGLAILDLRYLPPEFDIVEWDPKRAAFIKV